MSVLNCHPATVSDMLWVTPILYFYAKEIVIFPKSVQQTRQGKYIETTQQNQN
jgi:hypothetical protein